MAYDNLCKLIAENHPLEIATWILGKPPENIEILKTELSIEPIRADAITFFKTTGRILHIEFQTRWPSEPPMPLRSLDYWVRLHRQYKVPVDQYVILLLSNYAKLITYFLPTSFKIFSTASTSEFQSL